MILCIDTENTTWNKGNPFDQRNFNVCVSYAHRDEAGELVNRALFDEDKSTIRALVDAADLLVFFNAKYDLHWLRRLDVDCEDKRIWCCQVFEFLHSRQELGYPSLEDAATRYQLGSKLDEVKSYWDRGINTHEIPRDILARYAAQDAALTLQVYEAQVAIQRQHQKMLFSISMQDLKTLQEMEWNGMHYNNKKSLEKAKELETEISATQAKLSLYHNVPSFNWASSEHLSALLYGGEITETVKLPIGLFKSGAKAGQVRYKNEEKVYVLPRMYKPIKGSALQKENKWSVEEQYLQRLNGDVSLISGILKIKELEKLKNTYYEGLPALHHTMSWEENTIHGSFNQCVARTGRLSSSKPNLQNLSEPAQELFESRWTK